MFSYGHGMFLRSMAGREDGGGPVDADPLSLVEWALGTGRHMLWFVGAIIVMNMIVYLSDFILRGGYRETNPASEMFAPYGRIVTLHVAIILGAGLTLAIGQPLLGVLILILLRVVFGVVINMLRQRRIEGLGAPLANAVAEAG